MGCGSSKEDKEMELRNKEIEKQMMADHIKESKVVKLLLLGAGECGKSTILKQMKILHDSGFSEEEINQQKSVVYSNSVTSVGIMLKAMEKLSIQLENVELEVDARVIFDVLKNGEESEPFTPEVFHALKNLWGDKGMKEAFERRNEFQLTDSANYFLDALDRINEPGYKPTEQDVLFCRVKTTGIVEVHFTMKNVEFRVFDVGGQRSERKKWIHCFEDVNAIIFLSAISEYDQVLYEDETTNRMVESMRLFESICNSKWFINTSMILFLNKKDLFEEKLKRGTSIKTAFPEYDGTNDYDSCAAYIEERFEQLNANPAKTIYMHQTCATDTGQVQFVLDSVIDMIIQQNLQGCGLY